MWIRKIVVATTLACCWAEVSPTSAQVASPLSVASPGGGWGFGGGGYGGGYGFSHGSAVYGASYGYGSQPAWGYTGVRVIPVYYRVPIYFIPRTPVATPPCECRTSPVAPVTPPTPVTPAPETPAQSPGEAQTPAQEVPESSEAPMAQGEPPAGSPPPAVPLPGRL